MNRLHLHIRVDDLAASTRFYETLFGQAPSVVRDDYAKWTLEDPAVNLAISTIEGAGTGLDHVGIETADRAGLEAITGRLHAAEASTFQQEGTTCCYAVSDKTWVEDPSGVRWETFYTFGEATEYGERASAARDAHKPRPPITARNGCC